MRYWQGILWYFVALILQPFLYNLLPGFGITPNLLLCTTVIFTLLYEDKLIGLVLGTIFGLIYDICYGQVLGAAAFDLAVVAALVLILRNLLNSENVFSVILLSALSTWFYNTLYWVIQHFAGSPYDYSTVLQLLLWYILLNTVVCLVIYFILIKRVIKYRRDRFLQ